jgi:hypothetical protein
MAKHGQNEVTVTIDDAPGGTPRIITPYVMTIGNVGLESITQQTNPFGASSEEHTPVGLDKTPDIPIGGFYDDTASVGPKAVFFTPATWILDKASGSVGRVLVILTATGLTFTVTVHVVKAEIILKRDAITEYMVTVRQKSAGVWS